MSELVFVSWSGSGWRSDWRPERRSRRSPARPAATPPPSPTGSASTASRRHMPRATPARGPIGRELLTEIVACELSIRDMADVFERSPASIRHWLRRHGVETARMTRGAPRHGRAAAACATAELPVPATTALTRHVRRDGRLSMRAMPRRARRGQAPAGSSDSSSRSRRSAATLCGYDRLPSRRCSSIMSIRATKRFALSRDGRHALARARHGTRQRSACCCAPTVMLRSRAGSLELPLRSADRRRLSCVAQDDGPG